MSLLLNKRAFYVFARLLITLLGNLLFSWVDKKKKKEEKTYYPDFAGSFPMLFPLVTYKLVMTKSLKQSF